MRTRKKMVRMTEEEYFRLEEASNIRHEYVDGYVFAMSGSTRAHNLICGNIFSFLHSRLRGGPCRAAINDLKVKVEAARSYYYPDVMVECSAFEGKGLYVTEPALLVEVLSPSTVSIDRREKLIAYQKIPTLKEYMIVYQDRQQVELYRREADGDWSYVVLNAEDEVVFESLPNGPTSLSFATIYDGYDPPRRVKEEEGEYSLN